MIVVTGNDAEAGFTGGEEMIRSSLYSKAPKLSTKANGLRRKAKDADRPVIDTECLTSYTRADTRCLESVCVKMLRRPASPGKSLDCAPASYKGAAHQHSQYTCHHHQGQSAAAQFTT